jgi:hypothetical protein
MKLGYSRRLLTIFTTILEQEEPAALAPGAVALPVAVAHASRLDQYVSQWGEEDVDKVCSYLLDWNTNARHTHTCQALFNSLVRVKGARALEAAPALREGCSALAAYSERHFLRVNKLHQASYVLDYMVAQMTMLPSETGADSSRTEVDKNRYLQSRARAEEEALKAAADGAAKGKNGKKGEEELVLFRSGAAGDSDSDSDSDGEEEAEAVAAPVEEEEEEEEEKVITKPKGKGKGKAASPAAVRATRASKRSASDVAPKPSSASASGAKKGRRK